MCVKCECSGRLVYALLIVPFVSFLFTKIDNLFDDDDTHLQSLLNEDIISLIYFNCSHFVFGFFLIGLKSGFK